MEGDMTGSKLDIETEVEKIIQAVAILADGESYQYDFPQEYRDHIYYIHVERPHGLAVFYPGWTYPRTRMTPRRMRRFIRRIFRDVESGKTGCESSLYNVQEWWAKAWLKG